MDNEARKNDDNLLRFHGDAASTAVEDAAANYQSPSIIAAGADAHGVSIFTTMINLSLAMVCLKAPTLIEKAGLARRGAVILAFLNLLAWVPLTLAFLLSRLGITPGWFALLWFINVVPGMLLSFQRDNWLSNIIPGGRLGRYLGQRLAIKSAFYLGAFFLLGYILDKLGKNNLTGFAVIFTIAIAVGLIDFIIFTFMKGKKGDALDLPHQETVRFGLHEYFSELREKKLDTFILFTTFFYLTVGLSGPLYAVFMLNELHFTYLSYTLVISAEYLARVVSAPFWGRYADKAGNIRILGIVSRVIPVVPICWLFFHNLGYLVFVQVLSGTCWGAFDLCTQSYLYKVAPQPKKLRYIVYTRCLVLLCTAAGGLLGAFSVSSIFPTFGSKILSVFWLSGVSRALVVMYMMPRLVDLAVSFGKPPAPPEIDHETVERVLASKRGQFYRRERQAENTAARQPVAAPAEAEKLDRSAVRRQWVARETVPATTPEPVSVASAEKINLRLEHYRKAMAALEAMKTEVTCHGLEPNLERLKARFGLEIPPAPAFLGAADNNALVHHELEENIERLKARFRPVPVPVFNADFVACQRVLARHQLEENLERLKARFSPVLQPAREAAPVLSRPIVFRREIKPEAEVKPVSGLFRNKVGWARYMKDTLDAAFQDMQGKPAIITVASRS
jgi:hypothetical protein